MMRRIAKRPQAERDIEDAFVYIAQDNMEAGLNFLAAIENSVTLLAENPLIGSERLFEMPELKEMRMWPVEEFKKYLIFYLVSDNAIDIVRVIHSAFDYTRVFKN